MLAVDFAILVLLAAIWGASFLFIRVAAPSMGPLLIGDSRTLIAAMLLFAYARATCRDIRLARRDWGPMILMSTLNAAIPFTLIGTAELHITASLAAILNATTPLVTAVAAAIWLRDRLTSRKMLGLALGLVGVGVAVGGSPLPATLDTVLAAFASLGATVGYALGGVYARRRLSHLPSFTLATYQQVGAWIVLTPVTLLALPSSPPTTEAWLNLLALAVLSTALGYVLFFRLLVNVGPTGALSVTYLVPVFGLVWGGLFLGEPLAAGMLVGLALIFVGIVLVAGLRVGSLRARRLRLHNAAQPPDGARDGTKRL